MINTALKEGNETPSTTPSTLTDAKFTSGMLDEAYEQGVRDSLNVIKEGVRLNVPLDKIVEKIEALKKKP